ncbi:MAG: zinc ribbon domain-containing protein [bacterium]
MDRKCNACGKINREEAKFCNGCGSPLPVIRRELTPKELEHMKQIKKFFFGMFAVIGLLIVVGVFIFLQMKKAKDAETVSAYSIKFLTSDAKAFGAINQNNFLLEGMSWKMTAADIMKKFPYTKETNDPDFSSSMAILQAQFLAPLPHANFMSLGIYNGKLYAVKFEFGENESFQGQRVENPNKDEILYGRFLGLYTVFKNLFGDPALEKNDSKLLPIEERFSAIKKGVLPNGKPSNSYITWSLGGTKAELALFGYAGSMHLTVRFLNEQLWNLASNKPSGSFRRF